jgi:hypothetical protein
MQSTYRTPIELGTTVYGSDGQKVGDVAEIQSDYIVIEKGFIFTKDLYIPMATIASQDADGIRLDLTKDEVERRDWSTPPPLHVEKDEPFEGDEPGPAAFGEQHTDAMGGRSGVPVADRDIQTGQRREEKLDDELKPR